MASLEKYMDDTFVLYQLRHSFRSSPKPPRNTEIDPELTKNNYNLAPEDHGRSAEECLDYYNRLLSGTYIYGKDSDREIVRCLQWVIQAPHDLAPEQKKDFFKACYDFLNDLYGENNCISAVVHSDEIVLNSRGERVSLDHLHYISVPRVENSKHLSPNEKFNSALPKLRRNGLLVDKEDTKKVAALITRFYKGNTSKNETISEIAKETGCKYAEARKIYNAIVRKESEIHQMKLNSDALTSRKQLHEFHPGLQAYLDGLGIKCTVSFKSQGIERDVSYTVAEAKTVTRVTGLSIEEIKGMEIENERLHDQVKSLTKEIENLKTHEKTASWGNSTSWGKVGDKKWEKEIEKEY